jgi:hypothetical protein
MGRHIKLVLAVVLAVVAIAVWIGRSDDPAATRQLQNLAVANEHLPKIRQRIAGDPRFSEIQLYAYTGLDGAIGVHGTVRSEKALADLKELVASTRPPRPVYWTVKVFPDE